MQKIVLIDFSDTLVHRCILPEDVKNWWAEQIANKFEVKQDVCVLRFAIEANLCANNYALYTENESKSKGRI